MWRLDQQNQPSKKHKTNKTLKAEFPCVFELNIVFGITSGIMPG
jgi:hypothetical protein